MHTTEMPVCFKCKKPADQIQSYVGEAAYEAMGVAEYAKEDGTYNPKSNRFCCTDCYIAIGMPSSPTGWKAP